MLHWQSVRIKIIRSESNSYGQSRDLENPLETYKAILTKRDTRKIASNPLPEDVIHRILQAGRMAGSAKNAQPIRLIAITDPEMRAKVAACGQFTPHVPGAALVVAIILVPEFGVVGAPFSLFRGPFDAGRCAQNMMLAAHDLGLATCPATLHNEEAAHEVLGLPDGHYCINLIAFGEGTGERDPNSGGRPRVDLDEYVHWQRWS